MSCVALLLLLAFQNEGKTLQPERRKLDTVPEGSQLQFEPDFAPESKGVAYSVTRGRKKLVIANGKACEEFDDLHVPILSPDGKRAAFWASRGGKLLVVIDGKPGPAFDWVANPVFSPDGKQVAYSASRGKTHSIVLESGKDRKALVQGTFEPMSVMQDPVFSPDGKQIAYLAGDEKSKWVVSGKKTGRKYSTIGGLPVFSPDGRHLAYLAIEPKEGAAVLVVDDHELGLGLMFTVFTSPVFSPDGKRLACSVIPMSETGKISETVFVDTKKLKEVGQCSGIVFSPDSKDVYFTASEGGKYRLFKNDAAVAGGTYDMALSPVVSPDGKHLAFLANRGMKQTPDGPPAGGKWLVVLDGKETEEFDYAAEPEFSKDGSKLSFGARSGRDIFWCELRIP